MVSVPAYSKVDKIGPMAKIETLPWDVIDHWETDEDILSFLEVVFEDPDPDLIALTLVDIARAKGVLKELEEKLRLHRAAAVSTG